MFNSIKSRLIVTVVVMAVLLGMLIYFTSVQMGGVKDTLADLQQLQDVKSHVLAPQKDMNQFIAAMDSTVLFLDLGDAESAQAAFEASVDAEQDISAEFEYLEDNAPQELREKVASAHLGWEVAAEFMKHRAETLAEETDIVLARPVTELKVTDAHVESGVATAMEEFRGLSFDELTAIQDNDETNPVELADEGIDTSEELVNELLDAERAAGDSGVKRSSDLVLFGSIGVLAAVIMVGFGAVISVSRPLSMLKTGAEKIAAGDLDYTFERVPADEVGSVIHSVEQMAHGLKGRIRNLEEVAGVVMLTGEEIGEEAAQAKASGADVDAIIAKADQLKGLVGQMLSDSQS